MKKTIFIAAIVLFLIPGFMFAEEALGFTNLEKAIIPYVQLDIMCSLESFTENDSNTEMQGLSLGLDSFYKELLYDKYSQNAWGVATVNLLTGGMGSLTNGNYLSGTILQAGFVGSYTFMVLGLVEQDPTKRKTDFLIAEIGAVAFGIAGLVIPFFEISAHNDALKESLNL